MIQQYANDFGEMESMKGWKKERERERERERDREREKESDGQTDR